MRSFFSIFSIFFIAFSSSLRSFLAIFASIFSRSFSARTRSMVSTIVCVWLSISMFTVLPTSLFANTVWRIVSGISHTLNLPGEVSPTVSEHPSTATNPFGRMYLLHFSSSSNTTRRLFSVSSCSTMVALAWTCPDTVWPPISSPTRALRS